jgi:hypothetical protein
MPEVKSVYFGLTPGPYANGVQSSIAINKSNQCVEAHRGATENKLFFRVAEVSGVSLHFKTDADPASYTNGQNPSVALSKGGIVLEAHDDNGNIYFSVRPLAGDLVGAATQANEFPNHVANSSKPSVAINGNGVAVAVHGAGSNLVWRVGLLTGSTLTWSASQPLATGRSHASVSINDAGRVVVVYQNGDNLKYRLGQYKAATPSVAASIQFAAEPSQPYDTGNDPSVAITNDAWIYEVHKSESGVSFALFQRVGLIDGNSIDWKTFLGGTKASYNFDLGLLPCVATNDKVAVQVHGYKDKPDNLLAAATTSLYGSASLIFDRANWIGNQRGKLGGKGLRDLVLPASHDAAQYQPTIALQAQTLNIFGQLSAGVRWFDLRLVLSLGSIKIHHAGFAGVDFQDVLNDIRSFMLITNELVVLKISHFLNFNDAVFKTTVAMIRNNQHGLLPWLVTHDLDQRLAETPLSSLIGHAVGKGAVLVVMDNKDEGGKVQDYLQFDPQQATNKGLRRYRDWYDANPQRGDLTVFDIYSNTTDFRRMRSGTADDPDSVNAVARNGNRLPVGQFPKFNLFDGVCRFQNNNKHDVPCDLFLLSWTLTQDAVAPVLYYQPANRQLVRYSALHAGPNASNRIINLLYTDVSQNARSADVAFIRNGLLT